MRSTSTPTYLSANDKILAPYLHDFFNAANVTEASSESEYIETLLQGGHSTDISKELITSLTEQFSEPERMKLLSMWGRHHIAIEKILFRFGLSNPTECSSHLPLEFVAEVTNQDGFFDRPTTIDAGHTIPFSPQLMLKNYVRAKYLAETDKNLLSNYARADIEKYISTHMQALACTDILPMLADTFVNIVLKRFTGDKVELHAFLHDFFCNADYAYGMFAINKIKSSVFGSQAKQASFSPLITLLYDSMHQALTVDEVAVALTTHFPALKEVPNSVVQKGGEHFSLYLNNKVFTPGFSGLLFSASDINKRKEAPALHHTNTVPDAVQRFTK